MKEAFLMGILAMMGNADDKDINLIEVVKPAGVAVEDTTTVHYQKRYFYGITGNDTQTDVEPHITRYVNGEGVAS